MLTLTPSVMRNNSRRYRKYEYCTLRLVSIGEYFFLPSLFGNNYLRAVAIDAMSFFNISFFVELMSEDKSVRKFVKVKRVPERDY